MRVPTLQVANVQGAIPYGSTAPDIQQANLGESQALAAGAKVVDQVGSKLGSELEQQQREQEQQDRAARAHALAQAEEAAKKAREVQIADGVVDVQRRAADAEEKFKTNATGLGAMKQSGGALDGLDKQVDEVGQRFTDPTMRAEFQVRAKQSLLGPRKGIEDHASKQYQEGIKQTYGNLHDNAVTTAASVDLSPEEMRSVLAPVDQGADEFLSPEAAKAAKQLVRGDVSEAVITRRIGQGDVAAAEEQIKLDSGLLGEKRTAKLQGLLESKKKDVTSKGVAVQVNGIADKVRDENNIVTGQALRAAMPKLAEDDPRREAFETALEKQGVLEDKRLKELIEVERNNASNAINDGVTIPAETEKRLRKYDREGLEALKAKAEARRLARSREARGDRSELAEARRQQAEINKEAEEKFAAKLKEDPFANHHDFILEFTKDVSAREGHPVTVTPRFEGVLEKAAATEKQKQGTALGEAESKFSAGVKAQIDGMTKPFKKGSRQDEQLTREWGGYAALRYQQAMNENGNKPLNATQSDALAASIIHEAAIGPKSIVAKPPPKAEGPTYQPAQVKAKEVKRYGYSSDRKRRIPVYTDNSVGEPELNPEGE